MMKHCFVKFNWLPRVVINDVKLKKVTLSMNNVIRRFASETSAPPPPPPPPPSPSPSPSPAPVEQAQPPLVDTFGRRHDYLRISLTERCNLRCQYCMPAEGVPLCPRAALLTPEETVRAARVLAAAGVRKVRLTGGEPTLRADLPAVVRALRDVPGIRTVALTTNGLVLARRLPALHAAGLSAINVSLDSLREDRYERMARRPGLKRVLAGIDLALQLGYSPVKVNTVLIKGFNDDEILDFVDLTRDRDIEVRFIEFMPFSGNAWADSRLVPTARVREVIAREHAGLARAAGAAASDTARVWRVPGHRGAVGFVSSMTEHFCAGCNRLRLTADGNLKVCLFGNTEVSLRDALRAGASDLEVLALVRAALRDKKAKHAGEYGGGGGGGGVGQASLPLVPTTARVPCRHAGPRAHGEPTYDTDRRLAVRRRGYCTLTHLDAGGAARMVDVGDKPVTQRAAVAQCRVLVSARLLAVLRDARLPKGDALAVARVAGALAAKRTADLLPLCHPLPLSAAQVSVRLPRGGGDGGGGILVSCSVRVEARTGAEMEALTGCAVAALALYDMCKAVDRDMRITDLRLVHKSGGRSDRSAPAPPPDPTPDPAPSAAPSTAGEPREIYAPTNFMYF